MSSPSSSRGSPRSPPPASDLERRCQKIYEELISDLRHRLPKNKKDRRGIRDFKYAHLISILSPSNVFRSGEQLEKFERAARCIPRIVDMFVSARSAIEAGLVKEGIWVREEEAAPEDSDDEQPDPEQYVDAHSINTH